MTNRFLFFLVLVPFYAFSQVEQPQRFELELTSYESGFTVLNAEDDGILVIHPSRKLDSKGNPGFDFIALDTALAVNWEKTYHIDRSVSFKGYAYNGENYYLLFGPMGNSDRDFKMFKLDMLSGDTVSYTIPNLVDIDLSEFEVTGSAALIGGYFNSNPIVIHYDIGLKKSKVLPGIFGTKTELLQLKLHSDNSVDVLLSSRTIDKRSTLVLKTYDGFGDFVGEVVLEPSDDRGLLFGRVAESAENSRLVAGAYTTRRSNYSRGLFISAVSSEGEQNTRYLNYADLENFFNYMRAKRKTRVQDRIARKRIKGKKVKFSYRILVHDIVEHDGEFILIGEAFYPKYSSSSSGMSVTSFGYGSQYASGTYFEGYRYSHAVVIGFDQKGNLLWDNSFEIEDVLTYELDQYVNADVKDDKIVLFYLYNNQIRTKIIDGSTVLEGKSFDDVRLTFNDDVARQSGSNQIGGIEKWYSNEFFAYGIQRIKNMKDSGVKLNRRVFYINKIRYK